MPSPDPLTLFGVVAALSPDVLDKAERRLRALEVRAVQDAPPTPGAFRAIGAFKDAGQTVTVVSNNSTACVDKFLRDHGVQHQIDGLSCRTEADPRLLKPSPHLLTAALVARGASPGDAVMIGDSVTDIDAARAAGVAVIAYANKSGKAELFDEYRPDGIITDMAALVGPALRRRD